jgi:dTMP kinase
LTGRITGGAGPFDRRALALLFAADRLDHLRAEIEPRLAAGVDVVCDRYVLSSLAYQSLDAPAAWVAELNRFAPPPDLTLFLRVRPEVALGRREAASTGAADLFERLPLQRKIARGYERAVAALGRRHRVVTIDGERPLEEVTEACWAALSRRRSR